ncbi:hypothetical protein GGP50_000813 [Salinibacter ruber]|nr:hypothetical protein [Salinibacter ruber]MCS3666879.1 hypothetical protein [Salinibacter ruber]MCS4192613.1 hypothetical protein [Salinibacter ruber]
MPVKPSSKLLFLTVALGNHLHEVDNNGLLGIDLLVIEAQKDVHRHEGRALIAAAVAVIAGQSHAARGGKPVHARIVAVGLEVLRAGQCRLNRALIASTGQAAVLLQRIVVNCIDDFSGEPAGGVHLRREDYWSESARSAFR